MRKLILILSLCFSPLLFAQDDSASSTAKAWLELVDAGNYSESWQQTDDFFKEQVSVSKWDETLAAVRPPFGKMISRTELNQQNHAALPGAPDGEYLIIQFQTEFENKQAAVETLTLSKASGDWLPVGYFIQ
ncbi:DUF4019 domain-containing protein [Shewanella sp. AS1]|uniref:DUF4019 domain-containing protein n=1 Tax=Shewanella sp. AS1 TaxID=2907626 RepID=UPI001F4238AA|nr:DUF4019 domain-containing protein [Shewanella sp. AS1]MCE9677768.1 DUF4019 domain-containing protein [Shewanella sp. AS1]